jgi:ATP-dependent DNA helicase DinG
LRFLKLVAKKTPTFNDYLSAFPFQEISPNQRRVLQEICDAFNSGYRVIVLEAPTGFVRSQVAICVARTLGSSYIFCAPELQAQYVNDFPFIRVIKGMDNFKCFVKEDFALSGIYKCSICRPMIRYEECNHTSVEYGPCCTRHSDYTHYPESCPKCPNSDYYDYYSEGIDNSYYSDCRDRSTKFHNGCRYRTFPEDYTVKHRNTTNEAVYIDHFRFNGYKKRCVPGRWDHFNKLKKGKIKGVDQFQACPYYDQLNKGLNASHSIFNYENLMMLLKMDTFTKRELLILDEGNQIEDQIIRQTSISITRQILQKYDPPKQEDIPKIRKRLQKHIPTKLLDNITLDYSSSMTKWLKFLENLELSLNKYSIPSTTEIEIDSRDYLQKLETVIEDMRLKPYNWIVSNIEREEDTGKWKQQQLFGYIYNNNNNSQGDGLMRKNIVNRKVRKIEFKPRDVSPYCIGLFEKCNRTLIMSTTALNVGSFCRKVGLKRDNVKFIQVPSDFH